jgi:branched-chain amino acid transport system substrate-binding protein
MTRRGFRCRHSVSCLVMVAVAATMTACSSSDSGSSAGSTSGSSSGGGSSSGAASGSPLLIGYINDSGGPVGYPSNDGGIQAAVAYINNELGGVQGHPLKLISCLEDGTSAETQKCAQQMVAEKPLLVSFGLVNNSAVVYPLLNAAGIPVIGGTPVTPDYKAKDAFFFQGGGIAGEYGMVLLLHRNYPQAKSVGIVDLDIPQGHAAATTVNSLLATFGIASKAVFVSPTATDFLAPLSGVDPSKQDAILALTTQAGCISLAQAVQTQNLKLPVIYVGACNDAKVIKQAAGAMTGSYVRSEGPDANGNDPGVVKYRNALKKYVPSGVLGNTSEDTFADTMTIYNVLTKLGPDTTSSQIISTLNSTPGKTYFGQSYQCGQSKTYTSICSFATFWSQVVDAAGTLKDPSGGLAIDPGKLLDS